MSLDAVVNDEEGGGAWCGAEDDRRKSGVYSAEGLAWGGVGGRAGQVAGSLESRFDRVQRVQRAIDCETGYCAGLQE